MAKIVTITNPLTGQPAQVDQLDHTAQQIDDGLNIARGVSNPNLLDNWYFGNPVNQRGQTSYTGAGYGIDRWKGYDSGQVVLIYNDHISIKHGANNGIIEFFDNDYFAILSNKTLTLSYLLMNNILLVHTFTTGSTKGWYPKEIDGHKIEFGHTETPYVMITSANDIDVKAAKLEMGTTQTLAHKDDNGNWQLNEIPDYGDHLARCKRVYQRISSSGLIVLRQSNIADKFVIIKSFEVEMAGTPKLNLIKPITVFTPITSSLFQGTAIDGYVTNSKGIQYAKIVSSVDLSNVQAGFVGYVDNNDDVIEAYVEGLGG